MRFVTPLALLVSVLLGNGTASAEPPERLVFQGTMGELASGPAANGTYTLRAEIFELAVPPVGVVEDPLYAQDVTTYVAGGAYSIPLDPSLLPTPAPGALQAALGEGPRFLQVTVISGPGITTPEPLLPRQLLASVPYALSARSAERAKTVEVDADATCGSEGALRYNPTLRELEFCDGSQWRVPGTNPVGWAQCQSNTVLTVNSQWTFLDTCGEVTIEVTRPSLLFVRGGLNHAYLTTQGSVSLGLMLDSDPDPTQCSWNNVTSSLHPSQLPLSISCHWRAPVAPGTRRVRLAVYQVANHVTYNIAGLVWSVEAIPLD